MPRQRQYSESAVLEGAMYAFWARGYEATSMNDLVEATGINRGSIYTAFADKRALFFESLRHYDRRFRAEILNDIVRSHAPRDAITAVFEAAAASASDAEFPAGCFLINTALEVSPHDSEIQTYVNSCIREVEDFFYGRIEAAKEEGTVAESLPSRLTAQGLLGLLIGLRVLTRANADKVVVDGITFQAARMLEGR